MKKLILILIPLFFFMSCTQEDSESVNPYDKQNIRYTYNATDEELTALLDDGKIVYHRANNADYEQNVIMGHWLYTKDKYTYAYIFYESDGVSKYSYSYYYNSSLTDLRQGYAYYYKEDDDSFCFYGKYGINTNTHTYYSDNFKYKVSPNYLYVEEYYCSETKW